MERNTIQKAKVGDTKVYQGVQYYVHSLNAKGQPLWRKMDKKKSEGAGDSGSSPSSAPAAKTAPTQTGSQEEKKGTAYSKPKAKIKYSVAPAVEIDIPEQWDIKTSDGSVKTAHRDKLIEMYNGFDDDKLISRFNDGKMSAKNLQLIYDVLASRGIDESKLKFPKKLQDFWKKEEERVAKIKKLTSAGGEDDEEEDYDDNLKGFDVEGFMSQFENGDMGWMEKSDKRVRQAFNNFTTLTDRQKYDAFLDKMKRQQPDYQKPKEVIADLNLAYLAFITTDMSPLFISSGGAGAGKTYGMNKILEALNYKPLNEEAGEDPSETDWGYVKCPNPKSDKEFFRMLKKYNGTDAQGNPHILIFDDADSILTGKQYQTTMKTIADTDPDSRLFKDPDGGGVIKFTGKIMVISNKTGDDLLSNSDSPEDIKAILSRATKSDIQFTVEENIEVLRDRYKTMEIAGLTMSPSDEAKAREEAFQFIVDNKDKLDPAKFSVRKFREVMVEIQSDIKGSEASKNNAQIRALIGDRTGKTWKRKALQILNKAEDDVFEKAKSNPSKEVKSKLEEIKRNNPKLYKELFGALTPEQGTKRAIKEEKENREETDEEVKKAFEDSISDMSVSEAEEILGI